MVVVSQIRKRSAHHGPPVFGASRACRCRAASRIRRVLVAGDAQSYVWIGPDYQSVSAAGATTTPLNGQLIVGNIATANAIYNNDVDDDGLTYSSPVIHTVRAKHCIPSLVLDKTSRLM